MSEPMCEAHGCVLPAPFEIKGYHFCMQCYRDFAGYSPSALDQVKAYAKAEREAGRQLHFDMAFAVSQPTLKQIQQWFPVPLHLKKAEALEWLARRALATTGKQE